MAVVVSNPVTDSRDSEVCDRCESGEVYGVKM